MKLKRILGGLGVIALAAVSTQLVTVQTSSAHTPSASVTCTGWTISANNYEAAQHNTYSYTIDGAAPVAGSFATNFSQSGTFAKGTGNHTLVGFVYQNNDVHARYSHTYNLASTGCGQYLSIPAAPAPNLPTCSAAGSATIPSDSDTVHWTLAGNVATATAQQTKFSDGSATKSFTEDVLPKLDANSDACAAHVTATAPVFANGDCDTAPSLTGATDGVGYSAAVTGTAAFGHTVTVTFSPTTNYRLDGQTVYTFTYAAEPDCRTAVNPESPSTTDAMCAAPGTAPTLATVIFATSADVRYTAPGGPYDGGSSVVVTATAADGYEFVRADLTFGWTMDGTEPTGSTATYLVTFAAAPLCVTAHEATFDNDVCAAGTSTGASITLPASNEADYFIDGVLTASGATYPAVDGSQVTVTAEPLVGYTLIGTTAWTHRFSAAPACQEVGGVHVARPPAANAPSHHPLVASSTPLASTGVATMTLVLVGVVLALLGGGLCLVATTRWGSRS